MRRGQLESGAPDKRLGKLRKVAAGNRKSTGPVSKKEELKDQHLLLHVCVHTHTHTYTWIYANLNLDSAYIAMFF